MFLVFILWFWVLLLFWCGVEDDEDEDDEELIEDKYLIVWKVKGKWNLYGNYLFVNNGVLGWVCCVLFGFVKLIKKFVF